MRDKFNSNVKKQVTAVLLTVVIVVFSCLSILADTQGEIDKAKKAQTDAESSLTETNDRISSLQSEKSNLQTYLNDLNTQLADLTASLDSLNDQIEEKNLEIEMTKAAIVRAQNDEEAQYTDMQTRIKYIYENSGGFLESLFSAENLTDFLNRADEISQIQSYDREKREAYKEACHIVMQKEEDLKAEELKLEDLKAEAEANQATIQALADETDEKIASYTALISEDELKALNLQNTIEAQRSKLSELQARAAKEAEDRRQAEEEARRAAEIAAEKAAQEAANQERSETDNKNSASADQDGRDETPSNGKACLLGHFMLTAYCHCALCNGRANAATASGVMPTVNHTVAMGDVPFGTKLMINGVIYTVEDRGTPYGHVDIFMESHATCLRFGLRYADVYIIE